MKHLPEIMLAAVLLCGSATAFAGPSDAPPPPQEGMRCGPMHGLGGGEHGPGHGHGRLFERLDANKDGKVTKAEAEQAEAAHFSEIAGGSPDISQSQFVDFRVARARRDAEEMFSCLDTNHDGKVSRAEFSAQHQAMFDYLDRNHDGAIERDEGLFPPPPSDHD